MRRLTAYAGVITLMIAVSAVVAEPQQFGPFSRWGQVWGTWVWTTDNRIPSLVTFHLDGTVSVSDGRMFGGVQPNSTTRLTPLHGVWERTGFQGIGGTSLYLIFDATTGVLLRWGRSRTSITFADDFDHFQGKMFGESLSCEPGPPVSCPDPQDPGAKWTPNPNTPPDGFPISGTRLKRVAAGPLP